MTTGVTSASTRHQRGQPGVHRREVVQPRRREQLLLLAEPGGRGEVVDDEVVGGDLVGVDPRLGRQELDAGRPRRARRGPRWAGGAAGVEGEALVDGAVEVDRELGHAQERARDVDQHGGAVVEREAAREAEVAVEPGVPERAAVDLDADLPPAAAPGVGVRLDLERRRVGVREVHPQRPGLRRPGPTRRTCRRARGSARRARRATGRSRAARRNPASSRRRTASADRVVRRRRGRDEGGEILREVIHRVHPPRRVRRRRGGCGIGRVRARRAAGPAPGRVGAAGRGGHRRLRRRPTSPRWPPPRRATPATGRTRPSWRPGIPAVVPRGPGARRVGRDQRARSGPT